MLKEMIIVKRVKDLGNSRNQNNRAIIGRVRAVTLPWERLYQFMFSRRKSFGF